MAIAEGDKIPDVELRKKTGDTVEKVSSIEALGKGRVVLFAVPGAFTPTCSDYHLPGFVIRADELKNKGVDTIACISVNDAHVMSAWGQAQRVGDSVVMLADGNGEFARAMGLELNGVGGGMGMRSQRYAAIIDDGVITKLAVETEPGLHVSSAESILASL